MSVNYHFSSPIRRIEETRLDMRASLTKGSCISPCYSLLRPRYTFEVLREHGLPLAPITSRAASTAAQERPAKLSRRPVDLSQRPKMIRLAKAPIDIENYAMETFQHHVGARTATKELAFDSLKKYHSSNSPMSRRSGTAGQIVLKWLWDQHDTIQDPADAPLIDIMTELVISENKEILIWDWIRDKEPTNPTLPDEICLAWRKLAFGALIRAKAKNMRRSLDDSLKVFFGMIEPGSCRVPLSASAVFLMVQLSSPLPESLATKVSQSPSSTTPNGLEKPPTKLVRFPKTSLDLWKRFHDWLSSKGAKLGSHSAELHQSYMWLFPRQTQKADPYPALGMLKRIHGSPMHPMRRIMKRDAIVRHAQQFSLCADLLDSMGDKEQARWARKANRQLFFKAATKFTFSAAQIYHEEPGKVVHGTSVNQQETTGKII